MFSPLAEKIFLCTYRNRFKVMLQSIVSKVKRFFEMSAESSSRKRRASAAFSGTEDENQATSERRDEDEDSSDGSESSNTSVTSSEDDALKFPSKKPRRLTSLSGKTTRTRKESTVQVYLSSTKKLLKKYATDFVGENEGKAGVISL